MLIDNETSAKKVYEWICEYTGDGKFDLVTGYFTIGALAYITNHINNHIEKFRFVLGDIVNTETMSFRTIDLLNETLDIEASLKLKQTAQQAVAFLKQTKVLTKTLEPNFCHAKAYIFKAKKDDRHHYFISGSSNLTEASIGLKQTNNVELNIAETGDNNQFKELQNWFETLWDKPQAHAKKTLIDANGKEYTKDFKTYLIEEIQKIFINYTPKELYYKVLFELFGEEVLKEHNDPELSRQLGRLENTLIYNALYPFQQKGVLSLIKMLQRYNGAILADAVGLGKTWSALAVIKFFQLQNYETILLCPKKLEHNWQQYLKRRGSRFEEDGFEFVVRFHTDLFENRLEKNGLGIREYFQSDKPKLIIIDESHNLRNAKSNRYKFLVDTLLKKNDNIKVLLLSATPINNTLNDIKNQFKLMVKDENDGFYDLLDVRSIDGVFKTAQSQFKKWIESNETHISKFIESLPSNFFKLTDSLIVARTRKMIEGDADYVKFPKKQKPQNLYITPSSIGNFQSFTELLAALPQKLSAYKPAMYIKRVKQNILFDEALRDKALVKMVSILLLKRLESSWSSFFDTIKKIHQYHVAVLEKCLDYKINQDIQSIKDEDMDELFDEDEVEFNIGKRAIKIQDIEASGELDIFITDLKEDIVCLNKLVQNLTLFEKTIAYECGLEKEYRSTDTKLQKLIEILHQKQTQKNKKVIIFSAYTDTARYIYDQLTCRGFKKLALVTGSYACASDKEGTSKNYESILQTFAPYTKLYLEKKWKSFEGTSYLEWVLWVKYNEPATHQLLENPIDILIATDVLSEGQNLQDADMVINYDIHWNPVRVIQRMGRIDRIGSPNDEIFGVNFWPSKDINDYLDLQNRIEQKMATMKIVGSEIDHSFTEELQKISEDEALEQKQKAKMLKQMQTSWDDIEVSDSSLGFNDLSLETFRQDLFEELKAKKDEYTHMPKGLFTGLTKEALPQNQELIALLKNRKNNQYELIYIDKNGNKILKNIKEVLEFLHVNKEKPRDDEGLVDIDSGKKEAIEPLHEMLKLWAKPLGQEKSNSLLKGLMLGNKSAIEQTKKPTTIEEEFDIDNYDLIVWFVVR